MRDADVHPCVHVSISAGGCHDGYIRRAVGNCAGYTFIETAEQCGAAAEVLGLTHVTPNTVRNSLYPLGCYFKQSLSTNGLHFNSDGNRTNDDTDRVSICSKNLSTPPPH